MLMMPMLALTNSRLWNYGVVKFLNNQIQSEKVRKNPQEETDEDTEVLILPTKAFFGAPLSKLMTNEDTIPDIVDKICVALTAKGPLATQLNELTHLF